MTRTIQKRASHRRGAVAAAVLASTALVLAGCGSGDDDGGQQAADVDLDAVLEEGGELTVWAWDPTLETVAEDFEELHENVDIELVNAGTGEDQYTARPDAMGAGDGVPDRAQLQYYAPPRFALAQSLADLSQFGAAELDGTFTTGPW